MFLSEGHLIQIQVFSFDTRPKISLSKQINSKRPISETNSGVIWQAVQRFEFFNKRGCFR